VYDGPPPHTTRVVTDRGDQETQELISRGQGTTPYLIYAIGVPDSPSPDPNTFDNKKCTRILIEIGSCTYLVCDKKIAEKTEKYSPFITILN
jgi:hypothetical protein